MLLKDKTRRSEAFAQDESVKHIKLLMRSDNHNLFTLTKKALGCIKVATWEM